MPRFNYIVPGIYDERNDARSWDYHAQAWLYNNGFGLSAGFNYFADVIGGITSRDKYSAMIGSDLRAAGNAGFAPIVCAGHSNGTRLLVGALGLDDMPTVDLHLIGAAMDRDCDANGLNALAATGVVSSVHVYVSPDDEVLGIPAISYGPLGKLGPDKASEALKRCLTVVSPPAPGCGHCDWVSKYFAWTMERIGGNS